MLSLKLPYPPSANHYYDSKTYRGKVIKYISKIGQRFIEDVKSISSPHLPDKGCVFREGLKLAVYVDVCMPDKRKRDLDNLLKATQDALQFAKVIADDFDIDSICVTRNGVVKGGSMNVRIVVLNSREHVRIIEQQMSGVYEQLM